MSIHLVLIRDRLILVETDHVSPDPGEEAAVCAAWVICHRPFSENNREIGYEVMRQMLREAALSWPRAEEDAAAIEAMFVALEEGKISEAEFVDWVCLRVATA